MKLEFPKIKLGRVLGSGSYKTAYVVAGHPDLIVLKSRYGDGEGSTKREIRQLRWLRTKGLPALRVRASGWHGDAYAFLTNRMPFHDRMSGRQFCKAAIKCLNGKTIADAKLIWKKLKHLKIKISDFQFVVDADGSIFICDPLDIIKNRRYQQMPIELGEIIMAARYAIHIRTFSKGRAPTYPSKWKFIDAATEFCHQQDAARKAA